MSLITAIPVFGILKAFRCASRSFAHSFPPDASSVTAWKLASWATTLTPGGGVGLRSLVESGSGKMGSWLKARIYDAIKELNGVEVKSPTVDQFLVRPPEVVRKALG